MDFYLTLPCTSSLNYFPDNRPSSFRTKLLVPLLLSDVKYEVALKELSYLNSFIQFNTEEERTVRCIFKVHVIKPNHIRDTQLENLIVDLILTRSHYGSLKQIVEEFLSLTSFWERKQVFVYNKEKNRIGIQFDKNEELFQVCLSNKLKHVLGFVEDNYTRPTEEKLEKLFAEDPPDLYFGSTRAFVYTQCIEPQVVGDSFVPLLFSFPVKGGEREPISIYPDRCYLSCVSKQLDEIFICNDYGEEICFDRGSVSVRLHFRPKKYQNNGS